MYRLRHATVLELPCDLESWLTFSHRTPLCEREFAPLGRPASSQAKRCLRVRSLVLESNSSKDATSCGFVTGNPIRPPRRNTLSMGLSDADWTCSTGSTARAGARRPLF